MSFIEDLKTALFVCLVLASGMFAIFGAIVGIYMLVDCIKELENKVEEHSL